MNSIFVICPYRYSGTWVFDDPDRDLIKEPFVAGIPEILDRLILDIPGASRGFRLTFSSRAFPGYMLRAVLTGTEHGGSWYSCPEYGMQGWLCPALYKYYRPAPEELYVGAGAI